VKRYRFSKHRNLGPAHGFTIHTPNNLILKDVHPQFIVRELNRLNDRIKRLDEENDSMRADLLLWRDTTESMCSKAGIGFTTEDKP
jgi:hypothetical protein